MIRFGNINPILGIYVLGFILLVYGIFPCLGTTYDSWLYLESAGNLPELGWTQDAFKAKPPLFSGLLFLFHSNVLAVSLFNAICWGFSLLMFHKLFTKRITSYRLRYLLSAGVAFSTPLFLVHNFLWTEPLFISLTFLLLWITTSTMKRKWVWQAIICLALVSLKHLGLVVVLGFAVIALITRSFKREDLLNLILSITLFAYWQWHTYQLRGDLDRLDHFDSLELRANFQSLGMALNRWVLPLEMDWLAYLIVIIALLTLYIWIKRWDDMVAKTYGMISLFIFLVILSKGDLIPDDAERYLAITHPLFLFGVVKMADLRQKGSKWMVMGVSLIILYTVIRTAKNAILWHQIIC